MRLVHALCGLAAFAFAHSAAAAPVSLAPIAFSAEFQVELDEEFGPREGEYLTTAVVNTVSRALAREGATLTAAAPIVIEISILNADPNRPTMQQVAARPGLDFMRSYSIGGAELHAVLLRDGQVLGEVSHRRYDHSIDELLGPPGTWSSARRAIQQFANKVADAYVAHASAR